LHPVQALFGAFQRNKTETLGQDIIVNDGGVIVYVDFLNCKCRNFGKEDTAEGVGKGGIETNKREGRFERFVVVELDSKVLDLSHYTAKREMGEEAHTFRNLSKDHRLSSPG